MFEEKVNNFKALNLIIKNFKLELNKKHQKSATVKKLERDCKLFLEGHNDIITSIALTSDNKYIISGGHDCTIRIWNFLEERQETVLEGIMSE